MKPVASVPLISVIILNYNGAKWLHRCLESLKSQTIFSSIEVILADNQSTDGSDQLAEELIRPWTNGRFVQHGENLGYCEGNNRAAHFATGEFLLFLNNDTWLEPECLDLLVRETRRANAHASNPLILNYDDDSFQSLGAHGFDIFGFSTTRLPFETTRKVLMPEGCAYLIKRGIFEELGGFDPTLFMFSDEYDLSWRLWTAGYQAVGVPAARLHHRGAANVNPKGGGQISEFRTSDTKRFFANRNGMLVLLKNSQNLLLSMVGLQFLMLMAEALFAWILTRRWSFVRRAYIEAFRDCWNLRHHILEERARISRRRVRSDFWMLRFLHWRLNRWDEAVRMVRLGPPKVTAT